MTCAITELDYRFLCGVIEKEGFVGDSGDFATCLRFKSYRRRRAWKKKKQLEEEGEELV